MFALRLFLGRSRFLLSFLFVLVGFGSLATSAYAGTPCTPAAPPKLCVDTSAWATGYTAARGCLSAAGHCGSSPAAVMCCVPEPVHAPDACGAIIAGRIGVGDDTVTGPQREIQPDWLCKIPPEGVASNGCRPLPDCRALNPLAFCCPPSLGSPIGRPATPSTDASVAATTTPPVVADPGQPGRLGLPPCATSHDPAIAGRCTLDDIKTVAVNFANFLMGLAAAFFLAIFVWAGFKYIFFAYDSGVAADAKKTLTGAAIGMLLVLGAASIVRFVQIAATGTSGAPSATKKTTTTTPPSAPTAPSP